MSAESKFHLEPLYLGLAPTLATLPVYEPALHSFATGGHFDGFILPFVLSALGAFFLCGLAMLLVPFRISKPTEQGIRIGLPLVAALGFLALCAWDVPGGIAAVVGFAAGTGAAFVMRAWMLCYRGLAIQKALLHIAVSCILSALLMNLLGTIPFALAAVLFPVFTAVGAAMPSWVLLRGDGSEALVVAKADGHGIGLSSRLMFGLAEPLTGLFLFSLMFSTMGDHHVYLYYLSFLIGTFLSGVCIVPVLLMSRKRPLLNLVYQVMLPLLGLVLIVVALIVPPEVQGAVTRSGFMLFYAFAAMLCCASLVGYATAAEFDAHSIAGASIGVYGLGGVLGTAVVWAGGRSELITSVFLALTCIYIVALAMRPSVLAWLHGRREDETPFAAGAAEETREAVADVLSEEAHLTEREHEILVLVAEGCNPPHIARVLFISESTVRGHLHHIYQKLGVSSREGLAALLSARQEG